MTASLAPIFTVFYQGAVAPSASVYVYTTGTTTPITTYSDAALSVPNTNPIIADANGQVTFYIPTTTAIRLDLYTSGGISSGIFIKTIDPVYPAAIASGGTGGAEASIASATTTDLGSTGLFLIKITGTTTITSFGSSATTANPLYTVRFTGALTLTYNASSMILPGAASIITASGDAALFEYLGSGNWQCLLYQKASGQPIAATNALTLLATTNASAAASVVFNSSLITNVYNKYLIEFDGVYAASNMQFAIALSTNNGSTYLGSAFANAGSSQPLNSNTITGYNNTSAYIDLSAGGAAITGTAAATASSGTIKFTNPSLAQPIRVIFEAFHFSGTNASTLANGYRVNGVGQNSGTTAINNIKIYDANTGANFTGNFHLYGISGT